MRHIARDGSEDTCPLQYQIQIQPGKSASAFVPGRRQQQCDSLWTCARWNRADNLELECFSIVRLLCFLFRAETKRRDLEYSAKSIELYITVGRWVVGRTIPTDTVTTGAVIWLRKLQLHSLTITAEKLLTYRETWKLRGWISATGKAATGKTTVYGGLYFLSLLWTFFWLLLTGHTTLGFFLIGRWLWAFSRCGCKGDTFTINPVFVITNTQFLKIKIGMKTPADDKVVAVKLSCLQMKL